MIRSSSAKIAVNPCVKRIFLHNERNNWNYCLLFLVRHPCICFFKCDKIHIVGCQRICRSSGDVAMFSVRKTSQISRLLKLSPVPAYALFVYFDSGMEFIPQWVEVNKPRTEQLFIGQHGEPETLRYEGKFSLLIHLTYWSLNGGWKPPQTGRALNCPHRHENWTLLLWDDSASHWATIPPPYWW